MKALIKCSNCGGTKFERTTIGTILATEGCFHVNAYACEKCGHIELFVPESDSYAEELRRQEAIRRAEEAQRRKQEEEAKQKYREELLKIINDENSTVKQVKEAQEALNSMSGISGKFTRGKKPFV